MKRKENKQRFILTLTVSIYIFIMVLLSVLFSVIIGYLLIQSNIVSINPLETSNHFKIIMMITINICIFGAFFSFFLTKIPLKPFHYFISQMNELTRGNYKTRLKEMPIFPKHPTVLEVTNSFNKLAEELEQTELLRSDFINNFSHEFKTPIVSIAGYAKLLKKGQLDEKQKQEYLDIIEEESLRLASMATNVLNMTKIENQGILSNVTKFNVSEQIRKCFLLFEKQWIMKDIDFNLIFDEYEIEADEELLKHVWMNLIDNAIKFSNQGGTIEISIKEEKEDIIISILNTGSEISEDQQQKIFNKFYQVDCSHSTKGNGIGLSLVKAVVELHKGTIQVKSKDHVTVFITTLPKYQ